MWRQNTHGRLYEPGKPLSKDLRTLIVNKIILDGGDPATGVFAGRFTDIARPLNVSSAVVSNVWKRFCTEGSTSPKKHAGGHPRHLSEGDLHFIEHLKENKPSITHEEIIRKLNEFGDLPYAGSVSTSTISRAVQSHLPSGRKYSFKKINHISQERFTLQNMAYTQLFIDYLHSKDPYAIHFFDECGLKLPQHGTRIYGHAPVGERAVELIRYAETPNITVNLMCSMTGVDYANTVNGAADTIDFLHFFEQACNSANPRTGRLCLDPGSIIVMDNCPTHHNNGGLILEEFLHDLNIELVYMPAYSPDFNPAEYVFGKIRTVMKYKLGNMTNTNIQQCVQSFYTALDYITLADMQGFYRITGYMDV